MSEFTYQLTWAKGILEPLLAGFRAQRANRLIPDTHRAGRILDIGCGTYPYFSFCRWRSFVTLYLFIVIHTGIHLLSWPSPRYRLPVDAVLIVFAGLTLIELAKQLKTWRRRLSPV